MTTENITGRDGYIIAQALMYAIAVIDRLPPHEQEVSNRDDMMAILNHAMPVDHFLRGLTQGLIASKLDNAMKEI